MKAVVKDCFAMSPERLILEVQHHYDGLPMGSILTDNQGQTWTVEARLLHEYALDVHKQFESETCSYVRSRFESPDKESAAHDRIEAQESQQIFQYLVKAENQNQLMEKDKELIITIP